MPIKASEQPDDVASIAAFSHAVECIYDCALEPARWPSAIREVCEATRCTAGVIGVNDLITGPPVFSSTGIMIQNGWSALSIMAPMLPRR